MRDIHAAAAALTKMDRATCAAVVMALGCAALQATGPSPPLSIVTSFVLLFIAPGFVLVRSTLIDDPVFLAVLTVAASLALDVLTASLLLYLRMWSEPGFAVSMGLVTVIAAALVTHSERRRSTS